MEKPAISLGLTVRTFLGEQREPYPPRLLTPLAPLKTPLNSPPYVHVWYFHHNLLAVKTRPSLDCSGDAPNGHMGMGGGFCCFNNRRERPPKQLIPSYKSHLKTISNGMQRVYKRSATAKMYTEHDDHGHEDAFFVVLFYISLFLFCLLSMIKNFEFKFK